MSTPSRTRLAYAAVLALLTAALGLGLATPAQAATITVTITDGAVPPVTNATAGDTLRFRNASSTVSFAVSGDIGTGPIPPGGTSQSFTLKAGAINYIVSAGGLLPSGGGRIVVASAPITRPPTTAPTSAPTTAPPASTPGTTPPATTAPPAVPGAPTPGTPASPGATAVPGSPGTTTGVLPQGPIGGNIANGPILESGGGLPTEFDSEGNPLIPELAPPSLGPGTDTGNDDPILGLGGDNGTGSTGGTVTEQSEAAGIPLNSPNELRRYGLPAVVGIVLMLGAASLIVRVLLATTTLRTWITGQGPLHRVA